jgi:hypothetical protein
LSSGSVSTRQVVRAGVIAPVDRCKHGLQAVVLTAVAWTAVSKHVQWVPLAMKHFFFNVLQHKKKIAFCTERGFSWWECLALAEWLKTAHPSPNFSFFYFPVALRSVSVCQSARLKK